MDPLTQLEQLGPHLGGVVAGITPDQLDNPTPCDDFTVRGVLEHMIGGATVVRRRVPRRGSRRIPI